MVNQYLIQFANGLSYGFVLFFLAVGFSLIFGSMGILNLAHGAFYMIGAYVGLTAARCGGNFGLGILFGVIGTALVGLVSERLFLARLYRQPNEQVLLTLGLVYIFGNAALWVWGPHARMGIPPSLLSGSIRLGDFPFSLYRLMIILLGLGIAVGLWWFQDKTRIGAIIRAGMDDKEMTMALGINYQLVSSVAFVIGASLAGFAGFIGTPLLGVHSGISMDILLLALVVVIVGGVGSIRGVLVGSIFLGLIDTFGRALFPDFAMFTVYLSLIIFLLVRPYGLLGRKQ